MRITLIFLALMCSGCERRSLPDSHQIARVDNYAGSLVETLDDKEKGIRCYVYRGYGISCVKVSP